MYYQIKLNIPDLQYRKMEKTISNTTYLLLCELENTRANDELIESAMTLGAITGSGNDAHVRINYDGNQLEADNYSAKYALAQLEPVTELELINELNRLGEISYRAREKACEAIQRVYDAVVKADDLVEAFDECPSHANREAMKLAELELKTATEREATKLEVWNRSIDAFVARARQMHFNTWSKLNEHASDALVRPHA